MIMGCDKVGEVEESEDGVEEGGEEVMGEEPEFAGGSLVKKLVIEEGLFSLGGIKVG